MKNGKTIAMAWMRIFCAVLLLFAGVAHQPVRAQSVAPQDMALYVLPDGTVADLCMPGQDDSKPLKFVWHGCEACRIASSILVPEPPFESAEIRRAEIAAVFAPIETNILHALFRPSAPPRGPPEFFV